MTIKTVYIHEVNEPGHIKGRIGTVDDSIIIDEYDPTNPNVRWYCDNCGDGHIVTAQFKIADDEDRPTYITLCTTCLQHAVDGIAYSLANPVSPDAS